MKYKVTERATCRICGAGELTRFLELPDMPLTDDFLRELELGSEFRWPLRVFVCPACHTAQTMHDVDVQDYYRDYRYSAAHSPFALRFMERLAEQVWSRYALRPGDTVVEVGSSDGAQLACFQKLGARVFGFEPSAQLCELAAGRGVAVAQQLFDENADSVIPRAMLPVQVMLLTYTFDHLPDPIGFLGAVRRVLDPDRGVLVIEVHDFEKIVERREYCLFAHEHAGYYTAATMQSILERAGFVLLSTDLVPEPERRGNSLLITAAVRGADVAEPLPTIPLEKFAEPATYLEFGEAVHRSISRFRSYVAQRRQHGVSLAGYGAGGRGVMSMAAAAHPGDFRFVVDANSCFHGYFTPGAHVPVCGADRLLVEPVDELIVFSFGYFREIYDSLAEFRSRGGRLISLLELV